MADPTGVTVRHRHRRTVFYGDHYVAALPLERIAPLVNHQMLYADPKLAALRTLAPNVEWMNGIQFYLRRDLPAFLGLNRWIVADTPALRRSASFRSIGRPCFFNKSRNASSASS